MPKLRCVGMTTIKPNSPVIRETAIQRRGRALVIELHPNYLRVRPKGAREALALDYATLYDCAAKIDWRRRQADAAPKRRLRR